MDLFRFSPGFNPEFGHVVNYQPESLFFPAVYRTEQPDWGVM